MSPLSILKKNESGFILVTTILIISISIILTLSIVAVNSSHTMIVEKEVRKIKMDMLANGMAAYSLSEQFSATPTDSQNFQIPLDGQTFSANYTYNSATGLVSITVTP